MHNKTILLKILSKLSCSLLILLKLYWQVEHYNQPHNVICIKPFITHNKEGKLSFELSLA